MYVRLSDARTLLAQQADGPSDHEGILDLLRSGLQLVPQRRLSAELLLQFAVFHQDPKTLQSTSAATNTVRTIYYTNVPSTTSIHFTTTILYFYYTMQFYNAYTINTHTISLTHTHCIQGNGESVDFTVRTIAQLSSSGLALSATTLTAQVRRTSVLTLLLLCI